MSHQYLATTIYTKSYIEDGERIAQILLKKAQQFEWEEVETLDETERGAGGFGHSGKK